MKKTHKYSLAGRILALTMAAVLAFPTSAMNVSAAALNEPNGIETPNGETPNGEAPEGAGNVENTNPSQGGLANNNQTPSGNDENSTPESGNNDKNSTPGSGTEGNSNSNDGNNETSTPESGTENNSNSNEGDSNTNPSHTYVYTDNEDGTHTITCSDVDENEVPCEYILENEEHTYDETTGMCICGAIDPEFEGAEFETPESETEETALGDVNIDWSKIKASLNKDSVDGIYCGINNLRVNDIAIDIVDSGNTYTMNGLMLGSLGDAFPWNGWTLTDSTVTTGTIGTNSNIKYDSDCDNFTYINPGTYYLQLFWNDAKPELDGSETEIIGGEDISYGDRIVKKASIKNNIGPITIKKYTDVPTLSLGTSTYFAKSKVGSSNLSMPAYYQISLDSEKAYNVKIEASEKLSSYASVSIHGNYISDEGVTSEPFSSLHGYSNVCVNTTLYSSRTGTEQTVRVRDNADTTGTVETVYLAITTGVPVYVTITEVEYIKDIRLVSGQNTTYYKDVERPYVSDFKYEVVYSNHTEIVDLTTAAGNQNTPFDYEILYYTYDSSTGTYSQCPSEYSSVSLPTGKYYFKLYTSFAQFYVGPVTVKDHTGIEGLTVDGDAVSFARKINQGSGHDRRLYYSANLVKGNYYELNYNFDPITVQGKSVYSYVRPAVYYNGALVQQGSSNSLTFTAEETGQYIIFAQVYSYLVDGTNLEYTVSGNVSLNKVNKVASVTVEELPEKNILYFNPSTASISTLTTGLKLKLTTADASVEPIEISGYGLESENWSKWVTSVGTYCNGSYMYDEKGSYMTYFDITSLESKGITNIEGRTYKLVLDINTYGKYVVPGYEFQIKYWDKAPEISLDQKVDITGRGRTYSYTTSSGYTRTEWIDGNDTVYTFNTVKDQTYKFEIGNYSLCFMEYNDEYHGYSIGWSEGSDSFPGTLGETGFQVWGNGSRNIIYTAKKTGKAVIVINSNENSTFKVSETTPIKSVTVSKNISKTTLKVPDDLTDYYSPTPEGMEIKITTGDGSNSENTETVVLTRGSNSDAEKKYGISWRIKKSDGTTVYNVLQAGQYYFEISVNGYDTPVKSSVYTVTNPTVTKVLNEGETVKVAKNGTYVYNQQTQKADWIGTYSLYKIQLYKGQKYVFNSGSSCFQLALYKSDWTLLASYASRITADESGTYYLLVKTESDINISYSATQGIRSMEVITQNNRTKYFITADELYSGSYSNGYINNYTSYLQSYMVTQSDTTLIRVTYDDGTKEDIPFSPYSESACSRAGIHINLQKKVGDNYQQLNGDKCYEGTYRRVITCSDPGVAAVYDSDFVIAKAPTLTIASSESGASSGESESVSIQHNCIDSGNGYYQSSGSLVWIQLKNINKDKTYCLSGNGIKNITTVIVHKDGENTTLNTETTYNSIIRIPSNDVTADDDGIIQDNIYIGITVANDGNVKVIEQGKTVTMAQLYGTADLSTPYNRSMLSYVYTDTPKSINSLYAKLTWSEGDPEVVQLTDANLADLGATVKLYKRGTNGSYSSGYGYITYDEKGNLLPGDYIWDIQLPYMQTYTYVSNGKTTTYTTAVEMWADFSVSQVSKDYAVSYDSNAEAIEDALDGITTDATMKGRMRNQTCKKNTDVTLNANAYNCGGFEFVGWSDKAWPVFGKGSLSAITDDDDIEDYITTQDSGIHSFYGDKGKVLNLSLTGETVPLYAVWRVKEYSINYHLNSDVSKVKVNTSSGDVAWSTAVASMASKYTIFDEVDLIDKAKVTSTDYQYTLGANTYSGAVFDGWYIVGGNTEQEITGFTTGTYGNLDIYARWEPDSIDLIFDPADEGLDSELMDSYAAYYGVDFELPRNEYSKSDAGFLGWTVLAPGEARTGKTESELITSYGFSDEESVNIADIVHGTGGKLANIKSKIVVTTTGAGATAVTTKKLTLYAVWKTDYKVTYVTDTLNKGASAYTDAPSGVAQTKAYGESFALPEPKISGYELEGWYTGSVSAGPTYTFKEKVDRINPENVEDLTLYAKWTPVVYDIKYDAAGGSGNTISQSVTYGEAFSFATNTYKRAGFQFVCWVDTNSKSLKADDDLNNPEVTVTIAGLQSEYPGYKFYEQGTPSAIDLTDTNGNVILYAVWQKTKNTYTLNTNGGYIVDANGNSLSAADLDSKFGLEAVPGVYGKFTGEYTYSTAAMLAKELPGVINMSKPGYTFAGWYTTENPDASYTTTNRLNGDVELFARWDTKYTIKFMNNAPEGKTVKGVMTDVTASYTSATTLKKNAFTISGYKFLGWATAPDGDVVYQDGESIKRPADVQNQVVNGKEVVVLVLYAVWSDECSVLFELNGGKMPEPYATALFVEGDYVMPYDFGTGVSSLPEPSREGYTFDGWYKDSGMTIKTTAISKTDVGKITLYAKWTPKTFKVTYIANAPEGATVWGIAPTQTMTFGISQALISNPYSVKGYALKGWTMEYGSTTVKFVDGQKISTEAFTKTVEGQSVITYAPEIRLYGVWEEGSYNIILDSNGVKPTGRVEDGNVTWNTAGTMGTRVYKQADTRTADGIKLPELSRMGYTFGGWYTDSSCRKRVSSIRPGTTGDMTLYAKWTVNR